MPSPFPGMDPYLEDPTLWPDLHQSLITYIRDILQPTVRPRYHVRIGERLYVVEPPRGIYPDVSILRRGPAPAMPGVATMMTPDAPVLVRMPPEETRQVFVEIVDLTRGGQVVTVIEVLSPTNKTSGDGRDEYRRKQKEVLASAVSLMEIDLLRFGAHTVMAPEHSLHALPAWHYLVALSRANQRDQVAVYPISMRQRLPRVAIPLTDPDPDVVLDLQAVFERCYDNGAYSDLLDYTRPPQEPLAEQDAAWADTLLREKGLRAQTARPTAE